MSISIVYLLKHLIFADRFATSRQAIGKGASNHVMITNSSKDRDAAQALVDAGLCAYYYDDDEQYTYLYLKGRF